MGKASRRKHLEEQQRTFFQISGDARAPEQRAQARAMLEALQRKLTDDALREDGRRHVNEACALRCTNGQQDFTFPMASA